MRNFLVGKAHYIADLLTLLRFIIGFLLVYYALYNFSLRITSLIVVVGWGTDLFDGMMARKFGGTVLGGFDLPADLLFSASILFYELHRKFLPLKLSLVFTAIFLTLSLLLRNESPTMFWMGMVYGSFIVNVLFRDFASFILLISWIVITVILNPSRSFGQIKKFFEEKAKEFSLSGGIIPQKIPQSLRQKSPLICRSRLFPVYNSPWEYL